MSLQYLEHQIPQIIGQVTNFQVPTPTADNELFFFLTEGGGNHPFARPWCLPSWSFPGSLMQIGWQVATLPVMLTLAILVVTPMARYKFILFYSFNPTKICVFFFRFGAPDLLVDQNSLCFWTRFRFTTRIPMHGTAVAHPQAVSLGFRSFGDCEAFHRKSGAKSWNEKRFFSRRGRCGRWNSLSVKYIKDDQKNKDVG